MFYSTRKHPSVGKLHFFQNWEGGVPCSSVLVIPTDSPNYHYAWNKKLVDKEGQLFQQTSQWVCLTPLFVNICIYQSSFLSIGFLLSKKCMSTSFSLRDSQFFEVLMVAEVFWSLVPVAEIEGKFFQCFFLIEVGLRFHSAQDPHFF